MQHWQLDFKDASSVPADPHGKKQHVVETHNIIDQGTSILVAHHVRSDATRGDGSDLCRPDLSRTGFTDFSHLGPRHPASVGAPQGSDFPAALVRFCQSLGVTVFLCDPHHPQQNGFVERYHRTLNQECLMPSRPKTLEEVRKADGRLCDPLQLATADILRIACSNQPPRVAFPNLPSLPCVPDLVDPDAWLRYVKEQQRVAESQSPGICES